jgi:hypothetical protein
MSVPDKFVHFLGGKIFDFDAQWRESAVGERGNEFFVQTKSPKILKFGNKAWS